MTAETSPRADKNTPAGTLKQHTAYHHLNVGAGQVRPGSVKAITHNSKCRYGERGAAAAKPKAQIILCVLSSILATQMPCRTPSRSEALRSATAACGGSWRGDPPERCLSRKAGIVRCCLRNTCKIYLRNRNTFCPALRYNKIRFQPFKEGTTQPWQK